MNTDLTPRANQAPVPFTRYEFEITDEHGCVLICSALPTLEEAERKGRQYVAEYQEDIFCTLTLELRRVEVLEVSSTDPTPLQATPVQYGDTIPPAATTGIISIGYFMPAGANPTPPLIVRYEFEITDEHDETVASGDAPTLEEAEREGWHYLAKYQQDGPCTLELRRVEVLVPRAPRTLPASAATRAEAPENQRLRQLAKEAGI